MRRIKIDLKDLIIKKNKCMDVADALHHERKKKPRHFKIIFVWESNVKNNLYFLFCVCDFVDQTVKMK